MSFARIRARFHNNDQRRLYASILRVGSSTQREELLVMAQRAEAS
ncbi:MULTISPECIES: hypothetical protein [unclassified Gordonia (in: high G+C Gram-positive bacteria)]|nr:hypothetical protein [Gordonia sp. ABSL49_1]